jgi:hypothetical protein
LTCSARAKSRLIIVSISIIFHSSFLAVSNNPTLYFWRIYETDFPEGPHVKAPRGFRNSLWSLFRSAGRELLISDPQLREDK